MEEGLTSNGGRSLGYKDGYVLQLSFNAKKLVAKEEHIPAHFGMNMVTWHGHFDLRDNLILPAPRPARDDAPANLPSRDPPA
jgi:hypothetical protein